MLKEKGYDEFLAEQIKQGLDDYENGRTVSLEDAKNYWKSNLERKALELAEYEREHLIYG